MKRRSRSSCRISAGASTRVTIRAFSSVISACRVRRSRAAGWGWPSPRSSSRRTAARSRSKAGSAGEAAFRSSCRHSILPECPPPQCWKPQASCLRLPAFLFIRTEMSGLAAAGGCRKEIKFAFSPAFSVFIYFAYFRRLNTVEKRLFKVKIIIFAGVQHQIIISNYGRFFFGTSRGRQQNRSAQTAVDRALHHGWGFQHHGSEP